MKKLGKLGVLRKRSEFLFVREGRYQARGGIVVQARENPDSRHIRVGFTATKKIGNAVIRNRAKRRMRSVASRNTSEIRTKRDGLRLHSSQFDNNDPISGFSRGYAESSFKPCAND